MKRAFTRLATIIFGIILSLLILEIGLHLIPSAIWKGLISKSPTRYILFKTDKNIGWVHVPNAEANWQGTGEYNVDVKMNALGLRDRERTYQKPADTFRILVLGDSFAEGTQVPLEQLFSIKLEKCLIERMNTDIEVINTGVTSYGIGDELLFFVNEGVKYQPDLVLVTIYAANDAVRDLGRDIDDNMIQSFGGYQFYLDDGHLKKYWLAWADPPEEISPLERFLRHYSALFYIFRAPDSRVRREVNKFIDDWGPESASPEPALANPKDFPDYAYDESLIIFAEGFPDNPGVPPRIKELWQLFEAIVQELQGQVKAHNAQMATVIIPADFQIHEEMYNYRVSKFQKRYGSLESLDWDIEAPNKAIAHFMRQNNIPTLDLMPDFQVYDAAHDDLLYFSQDLHFNERGHQLAADLMCNWLVEEGLVSSN